MGSGGSGPYSGTGGGSQAYADSYHVVDKEISKDKKDPDIYNPKTGYFHNPTATKIQDVANGNAIYIDGKKPNGPITYVLDKSDNIIIGKRKNPNDSSSSSYGILRHPKRIIPVAMEPWIKVNNFYFMPHQLQKVLQCISLQTGAIIIYMLTCYRLYLHFNIFFIIFINDLTGCFNL